MAMGFMYTSALQTALPILCRQIPTGGWCSGVPRMACIPGCSKYLQGGLADSGDEGYEWVIMIVKQPLF